MIVITVITTTTITIAICLHVNTLFDKNSPFNSGRQGEKRTPIEGEIAIMPPSDRAVEGPMDRYIRLKSEIDTLSEDLAAMALVVGSCKLSL